MKRQMKYFLMAIIATVITTGAAMAQDMNKDQVRTQTRENLTEEQHLMLQERKQERIMLREQFKASLTEEQKAILQNQEMTQEQKREQLRECFTDEQRAMLQNQMQVREAMRGSLTEAQKDQIRTEMRQGNREITRETMTGNGGNGGTRKGQ